MIRIYTIGYEGRGPGTVLNALKERSVRWLVDVRNTASGHYVSQRFNRRVLVVQCARVGCGYAHLQSLGVPVGERKREAALGFPSYRERIEKSLGEVRSGTRPRRKDDVRRWNDLGILAQLAAGGPIALLCKERDHATCHRSVLADLLAVHLHSLGHEVAVKHL